MKRRAVAIALLAALAAAPTPPVTAAEFDSGVLSGLAARNVGSAAMSGRISALAARVTEDGRVEVFAGSASGGVWKSNDGATSFKPVFDRQPVQSIGALAIDPRNPRTVWAGTGEAWTRNSVSIGNGIYRSGDGGETWQHMGLEGSERIAKVLVDPRRSDTVFACVPGKLWSDSKERGLYRTTDGGRTWKLVLPGGNLSTGCSAVALDPANPDVVFAGLWDFRRQGWTFRSGGADARSPSGSGMFRSSDGGETWSELTAGTARGLPAKPWGRVEIEVAPGNAKRVYAFIESARSALFVSDDGGATWAERDRSQGMVWRAFYFAKLIVDPTNPDRVFKCGGGLIVSDDAGKSFSGAGRAHGDWHDLWIDPRDPKHVIGGDDGGLWVSRDGGNRWWKVESLPISQFYHVAVDERDPYHVYGGLQDNGSWSAPSSFPAGVTNASWDWFFPGDGFWTIPDPFDPDIVYAEAQGGYIGVFDRRTRFIRDIQPKAGYREKLRFNWNAPIHASAREKGTLYLGAQFLFRTRDRGQSWERISPDLTTNDPEKQKQEESGGVTVDNSSAEMHTTIYAIAESPLDPRRIWVGTDDGNVQLTRDAGRTWEEVGKNIADLPPGRWISSVEPGRRNPDEVFVTVDRHTYGDMAPHAFRSTDAGRSWTRVAGEAQGIRGYAHVIKEDPERPGLLYLGTELGLWISIDAGRRWAEFKASSFPAVAVRDLAFQRREGDLAIATHGRGIWIVDDLSPLRALDDRILAAEAAFLPSRPSQQRMDGIGAGPAPDEWSGPSAPGGATVYYYQASRHLFGKLKLEILDPEGKLVDTIPASKRRGINRVTWSMRMKPPVVPRAAQVAFGASSGPRVLPGTYTARLTRGDQVLETRFDIVLDRRAGYGLEDRKAQLDAVLRTSALFASMSELCDRLEQLQARLAADLGKPGLGAARRGRLEEAARNAAEIRKQIVATTEGGAITGEERIREHAEMLYSALVSYEGRPGDYQIERIGVLERELGDARAAFDKLEAAQRGAAKPTFGEER